MNKINLIVAMFFATLLFTSAGVSAQSISNTGPDSTNTINETNECSVDIDNDTDVDIDIDVDQDANSGDASSNQNNSAGGAQSGDASNNNDVTADISVDNTADNLCDDTEVSNPPGGGGGEGTPPVVNKLDTGGGAVLGETTATTATSVTPVGGVNAGSENTSSLVETFGLLGFSGLIAVGIKKIFNPFSS